jgi:hypothetical protein
MVITKKSKEREYPLLMFDITNGHVIYFYREGFGFDLMNPNGGIMDWKGYGGLLDYDDSVTLKNDPEVKYPRLKKSIISGTIVLFTDMLEGLALSGVETFSETWNPGAFIDYNKELTLKNK